MFVPEKIGQARIGPHGLDTLEELVIVLFVRVAFVLFRSAGGGPKAG